MKRGLSVAVVSENKTVAMWVYVLVSVFLMLKGSVNMLAEIIVA